MEQLLNHPAELLILAFLAITFVQSGLDKVFDWKGNLGWLKGHFEKTFMAAMVPLLLGITTLLEILTGVLSVLGFILILTGTDSLLPLYAHLVAGLTLLMLFFGQRIAKEYAGAFTLTGYFLIVLLGIYLLSQ